MSREMMTFSKFQKWRQVEKNILRFIYWKNINWKLKIENFEISKNFEKFNFELLK